MVDETFTGLIRDGRRITTYTLTNANGLRLRAMNYGGIVLSLHVPDRDGRLGDVVLGFDEEAAYFDNEPYFGAIIGRYANRIAGGRFELDGHQYRLVTNNGPNHLHGGLRGFDKVVWDARTFQGHDSQGILFSYESADGEEGYPGTLHVRVSYTLTDRDEWIVDYQATTDRPTPVNLTQHTYFNLADQGDILGHHLHLYADHFMPTDDTLIPQGRWVPVQGGLFDFVRPRPIGSRLDADHPQLRRENGYDHSFNLNPEPRTVTKAARVYDPGTGRMLEVYTTEPTVHVYTGNYLNDLVGKGGRPYHPRDGFCLETQHLPDSPNQPHVPSTILRPGETYRSQTVFTFSTWTDERSIV